MEFKQALAVSLLAVVAAALVLLMARALDLHTVSHLEPQLDKMLEELQAIRMLLAQGHAVAGNGAALPAPVAVSPGSPSASSAGRGTSGILTTASPQETLVVWYFHGTMRCPTCRTIESLAQEVVQQNFGKELASGQLLWKTANYEHPEYAALVQKLDVRMPVVALTRMQGEQILESKTLEEVWGLVQDKPAFRNFLQKEIRQMLSSPASRPSPPRESEDLSFSNRPNLLRLTPPDPPAEGFSKVSPSSKQAGSRPE